MEVRELATIEHAGRIAKRPSSGELFDDAAPAAKRAAISSVDSASLSGISSAAIEPSLLDMPQTVLLGICAHLRENDRDFGNFLFSSRDLYQRDAVMQARGESALHAKLSKAIARRSRSIAHLPDARRAKCYEALELQVNTLSDFRFGEAHRALIHALRELPATEHFQGLLRLKARLQGRPRAEQYRSLSHIINEISDLHLPAEQHRNIYEWLKNAVFALDTCGDYPALRFLPNVAAELLVPPEREAAFYEMLPFAASQPEYEQFETLRNLIENTSMLSATARAIFAEAVMAQSRNLSTVYRASILRTLINTSAGAFDANFDTLMAFARQQTQQIPPAERGSIAAEFLEVLDRFVRRLCNTRAKLFGNCRSVIKIGNGATSSTRSFTCRRNFMALCSMPVPFKSVICRSAFVVRPMPCWSKRVSAYRRRSNTIRMTRCFFAFWRWLLPISSPPSRFPPLRVACARRGVCRQAIGLRP
jgi:hypothetical protein